MQPGNSSLPPPRDSSIPPARGVGRLVRDTRLRMLLAAMLVGVFGSLAAVGFRLLISAAWTVSSGWAAGGPLHKAAVVLSPALGGMVVGSLMHRFVRDPDSHGISSIRVSLMTSGGLIRGRGAILKAIGCAITTSSGGSAGCEGPIARLGAALGSWLALRLGIDRSRLPTLVACGAAASIAGLFDAPIAAVVFSVEIILGGYAIRSFAPLVVASASATVVARALCAPNGAIAAPVFQLGSARELLVYGVIGCCCGILGAGFTQTLDVAPRWASRVKTAPALKAAMGGLVVGLITLFVPGTAGVGYPVIDQVFAQHLTFGMLAAVLVARLFATAATLGSGGAGGMFSPSLLIGACAGALIGGGAHSLLPASVGSSAAFAVVGAGAMLAAATHAPFTAVVLVYELTDEYSAILPAAIACVLAMVVASTLRPNPAYETDLARRGIEQRKSGGAVVALRERDVSSLVKPARLTVPDTTAIDDLVSRRRYLGDEVLIVVDSGSGAAIGTFDLAGPSHPDRPLAEDGTPVGAVAVRGLAITADRSLRDAVAHFVRHPVRAIPIIDEAGRPCGLVWRRDVMEACAQQMASEFASPARAVQSASDTPSLIHSHDVAAIPVPAAFVKKSARQIDLGKRYGLVCLGIRRPTAEGAFLPVPVDPSTMFSRDDLLIVSGPPERIAAIRETSAREPT